MDFQATHERSRETRPRRTLFGTALRALLVGFVASALIVVLVLVYDREDASRKFPDSHATNVPIASAAKRPAPTPPPPPAVPPVEPANGEAVVKSQDAASGDDGAKTPGAEKRDADSPLLARLLDKLEDSVVKIESGEEGDLSGLGSGFVVDERGLVATNYHVVANTTAARVRFKSGAAYEVAGYAAIDTDLDLAILSLHQPPARLEPLALSADLDPPRLAPVIAIGHPRGVEFSPFDGKVSRVLTTSQLPAGSQRFLRQLISGKVDQRWIQHTANISEGNSGGPLLDEHGEVIGINTWVDRQAHFGYALHVRHLRELQQAVGSEIEPLRKYARKDARVADLLQRLTPERLEQLLADAEARQWRPDSTNDYEVLQQLAWAVTVVNLPDTLARGRIDERLDSLGKVTERIVKRLAHQKWDAVGQITLINDYALAHIDRPMAGLFLFGVVERTVEGNAGERGALVKVAGSDQMLFLPLDDQLVVPASGLQCLILGVNYDGHRVRYGDNPLKLTTAHVIATRTLLPLEKSGE